MQKVSIPFKRESGFPKVSLDQKAFDLHAGLKGFNSLQTGKVFPNPDIDRRLRSLWVSVSIPFKRESGFPNVSAIRQSSSCCNPLFQFPSNGKVDFQRWSRSGFSLGLVTNLVSIPFKRESGFPKSQGIELLEAGWSKCFNSLQTGRWISKA